MFVRKGAVAPGPSCEFDMTFFVKDQERQGVPARWGDPARGIPTAKPPTVRESHEPGPLSSRDPLPLAPSQRGAGVGGGGPGRKSRLKGGQGSRLVVLFGLYGIKKRGNTTSQVPQ